MNILGIIPARGGSKRVPGKNIRPLCGRPLIEYTIETALQSRHLGRLVVSTEDPRIADIARQAGAGVPCLRPAELATDGASGLSVLQHMTAYMAEHEGFAADLVVTLQPTSPLRLARHIDESIAQFLSDPGADSLVSLVDMGGFTHTLLPFCVMKHEPGSRYLRYYLDPDVRDACLAERPPVFARNSAIYITRRERLAEYAYGGHILGYTMEPQYSIDIDTEYDFLLAELLMKHLRQQQI